MASARDVAKWLLEQLESAGELYQEDAVDSIAKEFGSEFTYDNENGILAIRKDVLAEFRKLTGDSVVWVSGERYWRKRESSDESGRQQEG